MATHAQVQVRHFARRHLRVVEDEELLADLIADPDFLLVGRQARAVRAVGNQFAARLHVVRPDAMRHLARLQVHDIEADMLAEADVGVAVAAIDGEWKHAALAAILHIEHE